MKLQIACIPGDGIGPEIVAQANKVLDQVAKKFGHERAQGDFDGRCID